MDELKKLEKKIKQLSQKIEETRAALDSLEEQKEDLALARRDLILSRKSQELGIAFSPTMKIYCTEEMSKFAASHSANYAQNVKSAHARRWAVGNELSLFSVERINAESITLWSDGGTMEFPTAMVKRARIDNQA